MREAPIRHPRRERLPMFAALLATAATSDRRSWAALREASLRHRCSDGEPAPASTEHRAGGTRGVRRDRQTLCEVLRELSLTAQAAQSALSASRRRPQESASS